MSPVELKQLLSYYAKPSIVYTPKQTEYTLVCIIKIKTKEGWVEGALYQNEDESFARPLTEFENFLPKMQG